MRPETLRLTPEEPCRDGLALSCSARLPQLGIDLVARQIIIGCPPTVDDRSKSDKEELDRDSLRGVTGRNLALTSFMFSAAMAGPTRAMLEGSAPPKMLRALRGQLESLCLGYFQREVLRPWTRVSPSLSLFSPFPDLVGR